MVEPLLDLASPCYGGLAQVSYMRSVLALRTACAARGVALQLDLGGGEALISRARAGMLARFLAGRATHLLFIGGDKSFAPDQILDRIDGGTPVAEFGEGLLLVTRDAARRVAGAHPALQAGLGDVRGSGAANAPMVFETIIDPQTGHYVADLAAFTSRWRDLAARA